jgi:uncharacterized protein YjiS (DUF1127 family)
MNGFTDVRLFLREQELTVATRPGRWVLWQRRWATRRQLLELTAAELADVGLSVNQQREEGLKAFWRG